MTASTLCILGCHNFQPEVAAAIAAEGWSDVVSAEFPARCGRPPVDWNELRALLEFQRPGTRGYGIPSRAMLRVHPDGRTESIGGDVVCLERTAVHQPPRDA